MKATLLNEVHTNYTSHLDVRNERGLIVAIIIIIIIIIIIKVLLILL